MDMPGRYLNVQSGIGICQMARLKTLNKSQQHPVDNVFFCMYNNYVSKEMIKCHDQER